MGRVVRFDPASGPDGRRRSRSRPSRSALVLGGGGFTGGVYEIGALRAMDLLSVRATVNQFDVYVGTSAGAFVAALTANGVTPEELMRSVNHQAPRPFRDLDVSTLLRPNLGEWLRKGAVAPLRLANVLRDLAGQLGRGVSAMDVVLGLAEGLPSGFYTGAGLEAYVQEVLSEPGRSDDFRHLKRELYLAATDLDSCERVVFGADDWRRVPISTAVRASAALPMLFEPVRVGGRELVDGGLVSTTNLDIAVERGATFVVVINPLVPYVNDFTQSVSTLRGRRPRHVSDMGFPQIGYQAFKLMAHRRLHEMARLWEERYPGVDIILIEPDLNDELMFQTSIMNFTSRTQIARHGFRSVALKLAEDYERHAEVCARHGIEISATRVRRVVEHFETERESTRAWRDLLEHGTGTLASRSLVD